MYTIIYDKETRRIIRIIDRTKCIAYGYSPNCAELIVDQLPPKGTLTV